MRLVVFDFDGTLFRSPDVPREFWGNSLSPPHVPEEPGPSWWVPRVILGVQESLSTPETFTVLMTGREESLFGKRVHQLLGQQKLNFDEIHLNPGMDTGKFKLQRMSHILSKYPFKTVEIWDDDESLLKTYLNVLKRHGYRVMTHLVKAHSVRRDS